MSALDASACAEAARSMTDEEAAVLALHALEHEHPTLTYLRPGEVHQHVLTWMEDGGAKWEERDTAVELAAYGRARFGAPEDEHAIEPLPGTAYSVGPYNAGREADLQNPMHYPVEAVCRGCKKRIVTERYAAAGWEHQERPGNNGG